jgi:Antitoxin Phd_YefM, type II toxin-antitoxin system
MARAVIGDGAMRVFASSDLQRNPAEIQKAALIEPVFLSYHDKPRYVMMSLEEYVRLKGATIVATPDSFPKSVLARIREIAENNPDIEVEIGGGLADLLEPEEAGGLGPR